MKEQERFQTQKLVSRFVTFDLDSATADRAGELVRHYHGRGLALSIPDAVIAATAILNNLTLVTLNPKDFNMSGLRLFPFDPRTPS